MMNKTKWLLLASVIFFLAPVSAQKQASVRKLHIGDKVPPIVIAKLMNMAGIVKSSNTAAYNNQLLILDLMSTGCSSCLYGLPKKDSLQRKFGDKIKVMVVTNEKEPYIRNYLAKKDTYIGKKNVQLPWVVEDKLLAQYFPYLFFSHIVWIYKGELVALTYQEYVDEKNIQDILDGKKLNLPVKDDVLGFDYERQSIFNISSGSTGVDNAIGFYATVSGYQNGLDPGIVGYAIDSANNRARVYSVNSSPLITYRRAIGNIYPHKVISSPRLLLEVKDIARHIYQPAYGYYDVWTRKNVVCYEATFPLSIKKDDCFRQMITDLNRFLGMNCRLENRKVPCLAVVQVKTNEEIEKIRDAAKQYSYFDSSGRGHDGAAASVGYGKELSLIQLVSAYEFSFQDGESARPLVINSNYKGTIIPGGETDFHDPASLRKALQIAGFELIETEQETEMFVFTEQKK